MEIPKYQKIINAIEDRFLEINRGNGYYSDLGEHVYVNKSNKLIASSDESAINIQDISCTVQGPRSGGMVNYFDHALLIESTLHFIGGTAITEIREGIADVMRAIGEDITWDGLAINTYPPEGSEFFVLVYDHEEQIIVGAKVYFIVEFRTSQWLMTEHDLISLS